MVDRAVPADILATGVSSAAEVRAMTEAGDLQQKGRILQRAFIRNCNLER
ncbi:hypothetical protein EBME_0569 [bacterium endosymbiont of Mortierella elongata FMR23-6]|nr:hypothetical protein EBME_0569 [bacterium endosymbiont of Mortierella elongata FMR23-6]